MDNLHGNRNSDETATRVVALEAEVVRLTRLLDAYRWTHGNEHTSSASSSGAQRSVGGDATPHVDTTLRQAQSDVRRLQSRVSDLEAEKLELQRESNKVTSRLRDELERLQAELQLHKNESSYKISELETVENGLERTAKELRCPNGKGAARATGF